MSLDKKTTLARSAAPTQLLNPEDRVHQLNSLQSRFAGYAGDLLRDLRLVRTIETPVAKTIILFTVGPQHTNRSANLHGSCTAAIFQIATLSAFALVVGKGPWDSLGVGRSIRVTYLKPVEQGDGCWVTSEVVCVGKRMCLLRSTMTRVSDGAIVASCEHERVAVDPNNSSKL